MSDESVWDRQDVTDWSVLSVEKTGSSVSTWLEDPRDGESRWLHKDTTIPANGREQGEDWSEVISTQIAVSLGVPCATTRMCLRNGRRGSISLDVKPLGFALYEGAVALENCPEVEGYCPHTEDAPGVDPDRPGVKRPGHNLHNIRVTLDGLGAPPGFIGPDNFGAFDVFVGYLILDALIANRDRHEQNWATLEPSLTTSAATLAPTYDHASSLGYNLTDPARKRLLADPAAFRRWAANGTAWRFEHTSKPISLVDLAMEALHLCSPEVQEFWRNQVFALDLPSVQSALAGPTIDAMSVPASRFAAALLDHNHERMRDAI